MKSESDAATYEELNEERKTNNLIRIVESGAPGALYDNWLFRGLDADGRLAIYEQLLPFDFKSGKFILTEGKDPVGIYIILSGKVKVMKKSGFEVVRDPSLYFTDNLVGEISVLRKRKTTASVMAFESTVETLFLSIVALEEIRATHPHVDQHLTKMMQASARNRVGPNGY
jgi:CRP-like cAMP-binding protein